METLDRYTEKSTALASGLSRNLLATYVAAGLLDPIKKGGICYFSERDRARLAVIAKGTALGFSLEELGMILQTVPNCPAISPPSLDTGSREGWPVTHDTVIWNDFTQGSVALIESSRKLIARGFLQVAETRNHIDAIRAEMITHRRALSKDGERHLGR